MIAKVERESGMTLMWIQNFAKSPEDTIREKVNQMQLILNDNLFSM